MNLRDTLKRAVLALGRIAPRVREDSEIATGAGTAAAHPLFRGPSFAWDLERIVKARNDQISGRFAEPVQLARAMKADDAIFTAYHNRVSPISAIAGELKAYAGVRGARMARLAASSVFAPRPVLQSIVGTLADHGIAIGYNEQEPNDEGTLVDFRLTEWPLEFVYYDRARDVLRTAVRGNQPEDIIHGNGRWIVFKGFEYEPWAENAALIPAALLWAGHAYGRADWSGSSKSHGQSKILGEMAQGFAVLNAAGALTPEAAGLLSMLQSLMAGDAVAGVYPNGAKVNLVTDTSTAWQIFEALIDSLERAVMRAYLGTDAPLGANSGAPGVDIEALFKIAAAKIEGDFQTLTDGLNTGLYQPWAAVNDGDSRYAPCIDFKLPDPDAESESETAAARYERFTTTIKNLREQGFAIDQAVADTVACAVSLKPTPIMAPTGSAVSPLALAPTDLVKIVTVNEARVRAANVSELPPTDARGAMFISELEIAQQGAAATATAEAKAAATVDATAATAAIKADGGTPPTPSASV